MEILRAACKLGMPLEFVGVYRCGLGKSNCDVVHLARRFWYPRARARVFLRPCDTANRRGCVLSLERLHVDANGEAAACVSRRFLHAAGSADLPLQGERARAGRKSHGAHALRVPEL